MVHKSALVPMGAPIRFTRCKDQTMKTILTAVAASLIAFSADAADRPEWVGYWAANAAWCENAGKVGEETPDQYVETGIFGLEWSCDLTSVVPTGVGKSWAVKMQCLDAGDAYDDASIFMLTQYDRLLVISRYGETSNLVRCAKKPE